MKLVNLLFPIGFLLISSCGNEPHEDGKKNKQKQDQDSTVPEFSPTLSSALHTFMPAMAQHYTEKIDKYYQKNSHAPSGTYHLMQRYKELFNASYDESVKNSNITVYFYDKNINNEDLLNFAINTRFLTNSLIHYAAKNKPYIYRSFEAYVDFANSLIGGGVMEGGFVQEEIMLFESTILPFIAESRLLGGASPFSFAQDIPLNSLDQRPVVLKFRMFNQIKSYGSTQFITTKAIAEKTMVPRPDVIEIYAPAMAAPDLPSGAHYTIETLIQMYAVAVRAFVTTLLVQHHENHPLVIHSGNWGAGAFGNSLYTSWAVQRLAAEAAYMIFQKATTAKTKFTYYHDAYDAKSFAGYVMPSMSLILRLSPLSMH